MSPMPWRELVLLAAVMVPVALLPIFGVVWLIEQGAMLWWLAALLLLAVGTYTLRALWSRQPHGVTVRAPAAGAASAERQARAALGAMLPEVGRHDIASANALQQLTERILRGVADAYHPGDRHAILRVTLPELLLMTERFAGRLRNRLVAQVPLLMRAELRLVPQGLSLGETGSRLWQAWRVVRLADPVGALLQELRGVIVNAAVAQLSDAARDRVAAIVAREIGEVAIDLYAGRFRLAADEMAATAPSPAATPDTGPVTVLLGGQRNAGKSSLINALAGDRQVSTGLTRASETFTAHALGESMVLVDGPGLVDGAPKAWLAQAAQADLILWVLRAHDLARGPDQRALEALRTQQAAATTEAVAPILLVLTHADRLPPPRAWAPPYDPGGDAPKEQSMRAALGAAKAALDCPQAVIVRCDTPETAWNIDALHAAIVAALPEAQARQLDRAMKAPGWGSLTVKTVAGLPRLARSIWQQTRLIRRN